MLKFGINSNYRLIYFINKILTCYIYDYDYDYYYYEYLIYFIYIYNKMFFFVFRIIKS